MGEKDAQVRVLSAQTNPSYIEPTTSRMDSTEYERIQLPGQVLVRHSDIDGPHRNMTEQIVSVKERAE